MNSPNLKSIKICTVHENVAIETTRLVRNRMATWGQKSWKCLKKKDSFHRTALWPLHWKSDTLWCGFMVGMDGYLGAGYPHQGITNVGFAPWLLKLLMVVPARNTAVLEKPLIFSFNTPLLWLPCRNYSSMLLGYPCCGGIGCPELSTAWAVAAGSPLLWEGQLVGRDLSSLLYLPATSWLKVSVYQDERLIWFKSPSASIRQVTQCWESDRIPVRQRVSARSTAF